MDDESLEQLFAAGLVRSPFERIAAVAEQAARAALAKEGPAAAVLRAAEVGAAAAGQIAEARVKAGQHDPAPACARGCTHCCWLRVEITSAEAALLATALPEGDPRRERVAARAADVGKLGRDERLRKRVPCALLGDDGACSVYAARPLACRAATSLDAGACARALESGDASGELPIEPWGFASTRAAYVGLRRALAAAGQPAECEELHQALARALHG